MQTTNKRRMIYTGVFIGIILCFSIRFVHSVSYRTKPNGDCIFNSYKDGDMCRDCPAGYIGQNCTEKCKHPTFGIMCSGTCDCSDCHHIVGCISTAVNIEKSNEDCIFNSYKEGDVCKDCPAGYFGKNCTDKCKHPTFGFLCLQSCDCPVCHHIVGCVSTTVKIDFVPKNKTTDRPELMKNSTQMIKLIIISTGSVMTVVLLIVILFTMCKGFTSANVCVNTYGCENVQVDNVYSEIS